MDSLNAGLWAIAIILVLILSAVIILITYLRRQARLRAWRELAAQLGLVCDTGRGAFAPVVVRGDYGGHTVTLDTYDESSGMGEDRKTQTYTRIVMPVHPPTGLRLQLSKEGVFQKVGKRFGAQDIQIGDPELDQRLIIKGQPEEWVRRLLAAESLRQPLLSAPSLDLRLEGEEIRYRQAGVELNQERLRRALDMLSTLATEAERIA